MTAKEILAKASEIVNGDRQRDYGHPIDNHGCTADIWTAYISRRVSATCADDACEFRLTPRDVCMMNILQKISRDANMSKDDNLVDIVGYSLNAAMIGEATDTPANSEAVERESAEVVRCFEWALDDKYPQYIALCRVIGHHCLNVFFDGHETTDEGGLQNLFASTWREFPPSEWDAKVAAVKAAAQPHNQPAAPNDAGECENSTTARPDSTAGEWPKWTVDEIQDVRLWIAHDKGICWWRITGDWFASVKSDISNSGRIITRAEAVRLIGEDAVREGERLAGVAVG